MLKMWILTEPFPPKKNDIQRPPFFDVRRPENGSKRPVPFCASTVPQPLPCCWPRPD
ncbi:hypothetical protein HMPREF1545_03954 [Oscillibacter sp. KLE 1728]|nr:hypothetical protein HMPREF1545_03954 [Oscillibacter sp. KLE 1728]ERK59285.1 hypothetical protein HMPREF1546_03371 [Oscillibacter sp. KLE 1745]